MLASCRPFGGTDRIEVGPQDARWEEHISHHTRGIVSQRERIRVVFFEDLVDVEQVGQSADAMVRVEPAIDGSASFASRREIMVVPGRDLASGGAYRVTLTPGELAGIPADLERYQFVVQVMRRELEVEVSGLGRDPATDDRLALHGTLVTADLDDADAVERVITADFRGETLDVRWQHDADGRHHEFTVAGITRGAGTETLRVAWEGSPLEAEQQGELDVAVPARDQFLVTRIDAVQDTRQYVLVHFSDELDPRQNLNGLVGMNGASFASSIERNTLKIFPEQRVSGTVTVTLEPGIRSAQGGRMDDRTERTVAFAEDKPAVRFAGRGVVLPANEILSVPIEAINVRSVQLTAFRVYEANVGQFLQINRLDGSAELDRTGRTLWRRTIPLESVGSDRWRRYSLDVTDVVGSEPGALIRLTLSINRSNSTYPCSDEADRVPAVLEGPPADRDHYDPVGASSWDYAEAYYQVGQLDWSAREDPCKDAYYRWSDQVSDSRNFLASNIGIVAKTDPHGTVLVTTTDLRTAEPLGGVSVTFLSFQNRPLGRVTTTADGMARTVLEGVPFYAVAENGGDTGYLKMSPGTALPTSPFDVGGATVADGLKGVIYGERGVWRPGDDIHLTFVLEDEANPVPESHPATLQLFNPLGQRVLSATNATPTDGFYAFAAGTEPDAPTGDWTAWVNVGGARFSTNLKVETVVPNRLKVELDVGEGEPPLGPDAPIEADLFGQWLNGAIARNLDADVEVRLSPVPTRFDRFTDFVFDDPARVNRPGIIGDRLI